MAKLEYNDTSSIFSFILIGAETHLHMAKSVDNESRGRAAMNYRFAILDRLRRWQPSDVVLSWRWLEALTLNLFKLSLILAHCWIALPSTDWIIREITHSRWSPGSLTPDSTWCYRVQTAQTPLHAKTGQRRWMPGCLDRLSEAAPARGTGHSLLQNYPRLLGW